MKSIRRIGTVILAITMLLCMNLGSVLAQSEPNTDGSGLEPDKEVSLTLIKYKEDEDKQNASDKTPLAGIPFLLQLVELKTGKEQGSTDPGDYEVRRTIGSDTGKATNDVGVVLWNADDDGLEQGIYLVTELQSATVSNPDVRFLVSLPMLNATGDAWVYDVTAYPKNVVDPGPDIDKDVVTEPGAGDIITWEYKLDIPADIRNAQKYVITDNLDNRLSYVDGTINGWYIDQNGDKHNLTEGAGEHYTVSYTEATHKLVITITQNGFTELAKAYIAEATGEPKLHFKFDTRVSTTSSGNIGDIDNGGEAEYRNENGNTYTPSIPDEEKPSTDMYGIHIYKINVNGMKLEGAKFKLYKDEGCSSEDLVSGDVYTTDENGNAYIYGLAEGVYYLMETEAPAGYNAITTPIRVEVSEATAGEDYIVKITVTNSNNFTLPQTGGTGTMLFTIGGLALIAVACALLLAAKKKKSKT